MGIGITETEQKIIIDILNNYKKEYCFYFYGSRVKGTFEKTSDLDILIKGKKEMPLFILEEIKEKFDASKLPYIVNFSDYYSIDKNFYNRIENDLFPYDWKEYKLEDICIKITDGSHYSPKPQLEGFPMLSVKDMGEYDFCYTNCKYISIEDYKKMQQNDCVPQKGDILVAKDGSYLKQIFICKETKDEAILSSIAIFRPNTEIVLPRFLSYLLKSPNVYNYIKLNCVSGSALPRIVLKDFKKIELTIPALETQQKIAKVLSAIDDKIELNNKINKNLEQQAQAFFNNLIENNNNLNYEFIGEICEVKGGKRLPKGINLVKTPNEHPYIRVRDLNNTCVAQLNSTYEYVDNKTQESISRYIVKTHDVLISIVGTIGLTALVGTTLNNANLTENCVKLTNLYKITPEFLLLFFRSKQGQDAIKNGTVGAVQAKLPIKNIQSIKIPIINDEKFNSYINSVFKIIAKKQIENEHLTQLRDTLLPKLMSGEIDVEKVEV